MLLSMTGYGKADAEYADKTISVEIKALNSKYCDISMKLPSYLREKELELRKKISQELQRGKINCVIEPQYKAEENAADINKTVVRNYMHQISELSEEMNIPLSGDLLRTALQMPEAFTREEEELTDEEWQKVIQVMDKALSKLSDFRQQEGRAIEKDFKERIAILSSYIEKIEKLDNGRFDRVKERLHNRFNEIKHDYEIDQKRFEEELVYYLEKFDIAEEKVRLKNHFDYFMEIMDEHNSEGKKLNFVAQEIGREINTIGSKANDAGIQKIVVKMKDELEKIKEQLMNVL
ncbi:MAG: YicC/YloC family endoribonuclease [Bacteroidales bacterium]